MNTQTKFIHHREYMVENIGLNRLIFRPDDRVSERVYFNWQPVSFWR